MNLVSTGVFGLIFLAVIAIISNYAPTNQDTIQVLFDKLNCPMPAITGTWNSSGTIMYDGGRYNYNGNLGPSGTVLTLTCTPVHTLDGFDYFYGSPTLPFAGFPFWIGDFVSEIISNKLVAFFQLLSFVLSPASLNILGFTIADIDGLPLMFVIGIYLMCYIAIGAMIYKIISPFAGAS